MERSQFDTSKTDGNYSLGCEIAGASDGRLLVSVSGKVTPGEMMEFQLRLTIKPIQAAIDAVDRENKAIIKDNENRTAERRGRSKGVS